MSETEVLNLSLNQEQIKLRIKEGKINNFKSKSGRGYYNIIQENVFTFINLLLAGIAFLLIYFGKVSDGVIYFSVALLNIVVGLVQEINAKSKLDEIVELVSPKSLVIRNKNEVLIPSEEIVLDDIVKIQSGDLIPSDGKICYGKIQVDEAFLTGESNFLWKENDHDVFAGSTVIGGSCYIKITSVGKQNLANQIINKAKTYVKSITPLQQEVNLTVRILFLIASVLGTLVILSGYFLKTPLPESLQITAVILGIIPNSLFAIINLSYALGSVRILGNGAIVQRLNSVESMSHIDTLCLDKTGTLTTKNLVLENIIPLSDKFKEEAVYNFANVTTEKNATIQAILNKDGKIKIETDLKSDDEILFNSSHKFSAVKFKDKTYYFGAPEILFESVTEVTQNNEILQKLEDYYKDGLRVLLFCEDVQNQKFTHDNNNNPLLPKNLKALSILTFSDELRKDLQTTLNKFNQAGIKIKIISGDNSNTVLALIKQLKLYKTYQLIDGVSIEKLSPVEFSQMVENYDIFGRITPVQKERIIKALIDNGHYVAMIGDGVNDVLSLKQANLSISLESGAQAPKQISDILLLKDSFSALPSALLEGQKIRNAIEDIFKIYLSRIIYLVLIISSVRVADLPFPFSVKQASLISVLTTGIPAIGLAIWASPGINRNKLIDSVLHFVLPASLTLAFWGMVLWVWGIFNFMGNSNFLNFANSDFSTVYLQNIGQIRSVLSTFLILAGILIVFLVTLNPEKWIQKRHIESISNLPKNKILSMSVLLFIFTVLFLQFDNITQFWDMFKLSLLGWYMILVCLFGWLVSLFLAWYYNFYDRFLGIYKD
jgi:cation-transporting P-type ATPase E